MTIVPREPVTLRPVDRHTSPVASQVRWTPLGWLGADEKPSGWPGGPPCWAGSGQTPWMAPTWSTAP